MKLLFLGLLSFSLHAQAYLTPKGIDRFQDISVNRANMSWDADNKLNLHTYISPANVSGNFVGTGTGNKGLIAIRGFSGLSLTQLPKIEVVAEQISGSAVGLYVNILVTGLDQTERILAIEEKAVAGHGWQKTLVSGNKYKYTFDPAINTYAIVLGPITGAVANDTYVDIPGGGWTNQMYTNSKVTTLYPMAMLTDRVSIDNGMPRGKKAAAIMLGLGGSSSNANYTYVIDYVKINDQVITPPF